MNNNILPDPKISYIRQAVSRELVLEYRSDVKADFSGSRWMLVISVENRENIPSRNDFKVILC